MIVLFVFVVVLVIVFFAVLRQSELLLLEAAVVTMLAALVLALIAYPAIAASGGLLQDYSSGSRQGYLTKLSVVGVIWKTNEGEMQIGTGDLAALQSPWEYSVPNPVALEQVRACLGKHATIEYRQWLIQPYRRGDSGYEVVGVNCKP